MRRELNQAALARLVDQLDRPCLDNVWRGLLVEAQVAELLGAAWEYEGSNWGGWDFVGPQRHRLEVKQSAALQPWGPTKSSSFSIAHKKSRWGPDGNHISSIPVRWAHVLLCAWHPITDPLLADHRDVDQWIYYVVPTTLLPPFGAPGATTINLHRLRILTDPVDADGLRDRIEATAATIDLASDANDGAGGP